jgi:OOP family OmpA-OmpF porin
MNALSSPARDMQRRRRRVGVVVALVLVVGFVGGALWAIPVIQHDLQEKVSKRLATEGVKGVSVKFSGQDATFTCIAPLADAQQVKDAALGVDGVRAISFDASCNDPTATTPTSSSAQTTSQPSTGGTTQGSVVPSSITPIVKVGLDGKVAVLGAVASSEQGFRLVNAATKAYGASNVVATLTVGTGPGPKSDALIDQLVSLVSVFAGRLRTGEAGVVSDKLYLKGTTADEASLTALMQAARIAGIANSDIGLAVDKPTTVAGFKTSAVFSSGAITLKGEVRTPAQLQVLMSAANTAVGSASVTSEVSVRGGDSTGDPTNEELTIGHLATLVMAMPSNLLSGEVGFDGTAMYANGVYLDPSTKTIFEGLARDAGITVVLEPRPTASVDDAANMQQQLNDYVAANPILFESGKAILVSADGPILDRVAAIAKPFAGINIEVQGHTDATGDAGRNLTLSQARAEAVVAALVSRGVPAAQLVAKGYGETVPKVPNNSDANRATNRRVEFVVSANN